LLTLITRIKNPVKIAGISYRLKMRKSEIIIAGELYLTASLFDAKIYPPVQILESSEKFIIDYCERCEPRPRPKQRGGNLSILLQ